MNARRKRVLFVCVHNSARSQMAEAFLNHMGQNDFEAHSAGLKPTGLNSLVIKAMKEAGIDISKNKSKSVFELYKKGELFSYVITVCDDSAAQHCPLFPGVNKKMHWNFEDPALFTGTHEEIMKKVRKLRDQIRYRIEEFIQIHRPKPKKQANIF
ncbi:MAG: arsenate reductase ArsC [Candidatus Aminicenantes bacterium]|nr:arsenate reductase ArsC [Candidatus Aminicenantes bacterium]